jgi:hypothetical protein
MISEMRRIITEETTSDRMSIVLHGTYEMVEIAEDKIRSILKEMQDKKQIEYREV